MGLLKSTYKSTRDKDNCIKINPIFAGFTMVADEKLRNPNTKEYERRFVRKFVRDVLIKSQEINKQIKEAKENEKEKLT